MKINNNISLLLVLIFCRQALATETSLPGAIGHAYITILNNTQSTLELYTTDPKNAEKTTTQLRIIQPNTTEKITIPLAAHKVSGLDQEESYTSLIIKNPTTKTSYQLGLYVTKDIYSTYNLIAYGITLGHIIDKDSYTAINQDNDTYKDNDKKQQHKYNFIITLDGQDLKKSTLHASLSDLDSKK